MKNTLEKLNEEAIDLLVNYGEDIEETLQKAINQMVLSNMKHLVLIVKNGWVEYRMGDQMGSHPLGDDLSSQVCDYLVKIIRPTTHEIIWGGVTK